MIILDKGELGEKVLSEGYDLMSYELVCVNNPEGFNFTEGKAYMATGCGNLTFVGYSEDFFGYNLERQAWDEKRGNWNESFYIPHKLVIRHFLMYADTYGDPYLIERVKREMTINEILR